MKNYTISIDTTLSIKARNEDELHEKALEKLAQMVADRQIDFMIEEEIED